MDWLENLACESGLGLVRGMIVEDVSARFSLGQYNRQKSYDLQYRNNHTFRDNRFDMLRRIEEIGKEQRKSPIYVIVTISHS